LRLLANQLPKVSEDGLLAKRAQPLPDEDTSLQRTIFVVRSSTNLVPTCSVTFPSVTLLLLAVVVIGTSFFVPMQTGLPQDITIDSVDDYFSQFGDVVRVFIYRRKETKEPSVMWPQCPPFPVIRSSTSTLLVGKANAVLRGAAQGTALVEFHEEKSLQAATATKNQNYHGHNIMVKQYGPFSS